MGQGVITGVLAAFLNPSNIYEVMTYLSTFAVTMIGLWLVFLVIRIYSESVKAIAGKADLLGAVVAALKTVQWMLIYSTSGMFIFSMFYGMSESYTSIGSVEQVNQTLYELKASLNTTEEVAVNWYTTVIEAVVDAGSLPLAAILYLLFHISSFFYQLINSALDVLFAVSLTLIYGYGFIAIVSMQLPEKFQLVDGFIRNMIALFLWLIVEAILMVFALVMVSMGGEAVLSIYKGFGNGYTAMTLWYFGAVLCMLFIVVLRVIAPFIAYFLSNNQSIVAATAAPAALLAAQMGAKISEILSNTTGNAANSMKPDPEGDRMRDKIMNNISDISHSTPREAASALGSGIANAARAIDQHLTGGSQSSSDVTPSSGGVADSSRSPDNMTLDSQNQENTDDAIQDPADSSDAGAEDSNSNDAPGAEDSNSDVSDNSNDQSSGETQPDNSSSPSISDITSTSGGEQSVVAEEESPPPQPQTNTQDTSSDLTDKKTDK